MNLNKREYKHMEQYKVSPSDVARMSDDLVKTHSEAHPEGRVNIQIDKEWQIIAVDSCVVEYCAKKKSILEEELKSKGLHERAIAVIEEFESKPFAFSGHAMMDRIFDWNPSKGIIPMGYECIRQYGLFHFMLEILQTKISVPHANVRTLREMVDWIFSIKAKDIETPFEERQEISKCLTVLPHSA
ncbi:MAG: hypothetical protein LBI81_03370 [Puniceicoccales bacterium]|jgi:hypothetical protein|nr:hypothetical protein [Puniceicoccales bacterium]